MDMTKRKTFPPGVAEHLGAYVYRLIDPRNGQTFYVGKGHGDRVFQHANSVLPEKWEKTKDEVKSDDFDATKQSQMKQLQSHSQYCFRS